MSRWKAFAIHLGLSALVIGAIAAAIVWFWYPPGLLPMAKADRLLGLIAGVDLVVGPLLTLIVFKAGKKSLRFDLTVIALLQAAALGYGLHTAWQSRPVYLVAAVDRFELVFANELDPADVANAGAEYNHLPWLGARVIGVVPPNIGQEAYDVITSGFAGRDVHLMPAYYTPYDRVRAEVLAKAEPVGTLLAASRPAARERLEAAVAATGLAAEAVRTLPVISQRGRATMLVSASDGSILRPAAVEPWPDLEQ